MYADLGLLILRATIGGVVLAHGLQKFGWLGGSGLSGTAGFLGSMLQFRPARLWALIVALVETVGAALMILGLLGSIGPFAVAADLITAILVVHRPKGFWNLNGGMEYPMPIAAGAIAVGLIGHGAWSLDTALGLVLPDLVAPGWALLMAIGVVLALLSRRLGAPE